MAVRKLLAINQPQIGMLVRDIRLEIQLTQEQFAAKLGVTCPTINRWENGHSKPSPLAIRRIEGILQQMGEREKDLLAKYFLESWADPSQH